MHGASLRWVNPLGAGLHLPDCVAFNPRRVLSPNRGGLGVKSPVDSLSTLMATCLMMQPNKTQNQVAVYQRFGLLLTRQHFYGAFVAS